MVASTMAYSNSGSSDKASKIRLKTSASRQSRNRRNAARNGKVALSACACSGGGLHPVRHIWRNDRREGGSGRLLEERHEAVHELHELRMSEGELILHLACESTARQRRSQFQNAARLCASAMQRVSRCCLGLHHQRTTRPRKCSESFEECELSPCPLVGTRGFEPPTPTPPV